MSLVLPIGGLRGDHVFAKGRKLVGMGCDTAGSLSIWLSFLNNLVVVFIRVNLALDGARVKVEHIAGAVFDIAGSGSVHDGR